jgi:hypothetical protein
MNFVLLPIYFASQNPTNDRYQVAIEEHGHVVCQLCFLAEFLCTHFLHETLANGK